MTTSSLSGSDPGFVNQAGRDFHLDGYVNVGDLQLLVSNWDRVPADPGYDIRADINSDAYINVGDLQQLVGNWGRS